MVLRSHDKVDEQLDKMAESNKLNDVNDVNATTYQGKQLPVLAQVLAITVFGTKHNKTDIL